MATVLAGDMLLDDYNFQNVPPQKLSIEENVYKMAIFCTFYKKVLKYFGPPVAIILDTPGGMICVWLEVPLKTLKWFFFQKTCGRSFVKRSTAIRSVVTDVLGPDDGLKHSCLCHQ